MVTTTSARVLRGLILCTALLGSTLVEAVSISLIAHEPTSLFGQHRENIEDMGIKVLGGYVRVTREWSNKGWEFNRRWQKVELNWKYDNHCGDTIAVSTGGSSSSISTCNVDNYFRGFNRGGVLYDVQGQGESTAEGNTRTRWATGVEQDRYFIAETRGSNTTFSVSEPPDILSLRWEDTSGNWIEYTPLENGGFRLERYGDSNDIAVTLQYDASGRISGASDHHGKQVLWLTYDADGRLIQAHDYTNRQVKYGYTDANLSSVTDLRGQVWRYGYAEPELLSTLPQLLNSKTDPNGHTTTISYGSSAPQLTSSTSTSTSSSVSVSANTSSAVRKVAAITDPLGNTRSFKYEYDKTAKQYYKQERSPAGKVAEYWYNDDGEFIRQAINSVEVRRIERASGKRTEYGEDGYATVRLLDAHGNITKTTWPDGTTSSAKYLANSDKLLERVDENGVTTLYAYDDKQNLTKLTEASGKPEQRVTTFAHDSFGNLTGKTIVAVTETFTYDDYGNLTSVTGGEGYTTAYTHDVMGNILSVTDPIKATWQYSYDAAGNRTGMTDPLERVTTLEYDKAGQLIKNTAPGSRVTTLVYDANGRLTSSTDAAGETIQINYDADGKPLSVTDAAGVTQRLKYDSNGRLVQTVDGSGNAIVISYLSGKVNGAGEIGTIQYPSYKSTLGYDKRGRVLSSSNIGGSDSLSTTYRYDSAGNRTAVTDARGRTTQITFDGLGREVAITDPLSNATTFGYDNRGNLISVTDANGGTTQYSYLKNDQQQSETRPLGGVISYGYDAVGNLTSQVDAAGRKSTYSYDEVGRLTGQQHFLKVADTTPEQVITFSYDETDNLTGYSDGTTSASYSHDTLGRVTHTTVNFGAFSKSFGYQYNAAGNKSRFTDAAGNHIDYGYDTGGKLNAITLPGVGTLTINGYNWQLPTALTLPGGGSRELGYDALMRLTGVQGKDSAGTPLMNYGYEYDSAGNITKKASEHGEYLYGYDTLDRLTTVDNPSLNDESYSYDALGNRLTDNNQAGEWGYNLDNQLKSIGEATSYSYDDSGSLISRFKEGVTRSYQYNAKNRLAEVKEGDSVLGQYRYDPFGRRISKTVDGKTTWFLYSEEGLIGEYDESGNAVRQYGWWPDGTWGTDPVYLQSGGQTYFYHNDHLGTPQKLVSSSGAVVWSARYEGFGLAHPVTQNVDNPLRFAGQYYDGETGRHYNYFRDYDASLGRYSKEDPLGLYDGPNTYSYAYGNPVRYYDPTGEFVPAVMYGRCLLSCLAGAAAGYAIDYVTSDGCVAPGLGTAGGAAAGCALGCLNPLNWFKKFKATKRPEFRGTRRPWTKGATPNSKYYHLDKNGKVKQTSVYNENGKVVGHVDYKNHGKGAHSGHGHQFPEAGNPASGHGRGKPHIPNNQLPDDWTSLPLDLQPGVPIGK